MLTLFGCLECYKAVTLADVIFLRSIEKRCNKLSSPLTLTSWDGATYCMQPSILSPLSSGLLQRISLLINLCATAHPGALFFRHICFFYVTQGLRAGPFHCLTRCLLSLSQNLFSTFLPSCLCPCLLIKGFYHAGFRVLLFSSANHQRVSSNSALS